MGLWNGLFGRSKRIKTTVAKCQRIADDMVGMFGFEDNKVMVQVTEGTVTEEDGHFQ